MPSEGRLNSKMIRERAMELRMTLSHGDDRRLDDPSRSRGWSIRLDARRCEYVVEALATGVDSIGRHIVRLTCSQTVLLVLGPPPGIVDGITSCAILEEVEVGSGNRAAASLLGGVASRAECAVRVEDAPDVANRGVGGDKAVGER